MKSITGLGQTKNKNEKYIYSFGFFNKNDYK